MGVDRTQAPEIWCGCASTCCALPPRGWEICTVSVASSACGCYPGRSRPVRAEFPLPPLRGYFGHPGTLGRSRVPFAHTPTLVWGPVVVGSLRLVSTATLGLGRVGG